MLRYGLPIVLLIATLALCYRGTTRLPLPQGARDSGLSIDIVSVPHGRCLYLVVERDGVYIGQTRFPHEFLGAAIARVYGNEKIDYAIMFGSDTARYGDFVQAYKNARSVLHVPMDITTFPVATGTRRGPIEIHAHSWEYE